MNTKKDRLINILKSRLITKSLKRNWDHKMKSAEEPQNTDKKS